MSVTIALATILTAGGGLGSALVVSQVTQKANPEDLPPQSTAAIVFPTANPPTSAPVATAPPPPGAQPVGAVDLGVQDSPQGAVGVAPGQVTCDSPGVMRIETASGTLLAGITQDGGWSCQATLSQWRAIGAQSPDVGARFRPASGGQPANVTLVNGAGRTFSMAVTGGWTPQ